MGAVLAGAMDIAARLVADMLTPKLAQPVAVENRPGGRGTIAVTALPQAAPEGCTLGAVALAALPSIRAGAARSGPGPRCVHMRSLRAVQPLLRG
ncbi:tripartite tricarboxylate transporter substrate-binding protein [Sediminicoccus sp. BL-A-41-H5]|uniref:tripartite tricarboxylate transporter substrate-binding protein n=1 Tax=Sediminicoccus sp. BL-A-41-H5 TaxID=3421106 RepID=UPI003D66C7B8